MKRRYRLLLNGVVVLDEAMDVASDGVDPNDASAVFDHLVEVARARRMPEPPVERALLCQ